MQTFNKEWNKKEMVFLGFPGGLSGKESACQSRRHRFDPWSGKIPYAEEQPSSYATTTEPVLYGPHSLQLGKSPRSNEDPAQPPKKNSLKKKKKWYSRMMNLEARYQRRLVKEGHLWCWCSCPGEGRPVLITGALQAQGSEPQNFQGI